MSIIYIFKNFNNYYNRRVKLYSTVADYISHSDAYYIQGNTTKCDNTGSVNFKFNDGVATKQVVNFDMGTLDWQPDYLLVVDENNNIISRWFVMECDLLRAGQYDLILRRDLIADHYSKVIKAPMFIEKATLQPGSPFLYNNENMTFNQIKDENEVLLKDASNTAWIVGYVAPPESGEEPTNITGKMFKEVYRTINEPITSFINSNKGGLIWDITEWDLEWAIKEYTYGAIIKPVSLYNIRANGESARRYTGVGDYSNLKYKDTRETYNTSALLKSLVKSDTTIPGIVKSTIQSQTNTLGWIDIDDVAARYELNGKIIKDSNGKYYQIVVGSRARQRDFDIEVTNDYPSLFNKMKGIGDDNFTITSGTNYGFKCQHNKEYYTQIVVDYNEVSSNYIEVQTQINPLRKTLSDSPYCMFCMPYEDTTILIGDDIINQTKEVSLIAARTLCENLGSKIYDLQLLPYCPIQGLIDNGSINLNKITNIVENQDYTIIEEIAGETWITTGVYIWCDSSVFNVSIEHQMTIPQESGESLAESIKVENETSQYRLCSPNYASIYEFNLAKNNGVEYFIADCQYKPYNPYIHIVPNLGGLYGSNTGDARGLVCSGDFSMPQTTDQWAEYEINNKNYNNSFNRQIENLQVTQKLDMASMGVSAAIGVGTGALYGARAGGIAGAVVGGVASAIGGAADMYIQSQKNKEVIDYTKDQFGYALGNIKARPDTLSKVSGYNPNNKIYPFLEHYHCTPQERTALLNKIRYNGMSLGIIGSVEDYLLPEESYIKGKIIRLEDVGDDYHITTEIADEMNKGVFIK